MNLFPQIKGRYTKENFSALQAMDKAELIAWGPVVFQVSRLMVKFGILDLLQQSKEGLTVGEVADKTGLSVYAVKILMEASLTVGTVMVNPDNDRFSISKTGWFLLNDEAARVNMAFNQDVNYLGMYRLEEALKNGKPEGLKALGDWPTIYEGLSKLPQEAKKSWFAFDHFYSDHSFDEALKIVFAGHPHRLMDVGGNTGRFALRCVADDPSVEVTVVDLPGQVAMMRENVAGKQGAERIHGYATDLLDEGNALPGGEWDAIWMSQFLDCFSEEQIYGILRRVARVMSPATTLYVMETFWDRQRFDTASFCLTMTSVYFTAMANGNSKMYHSDDMVRQIERAGLRVVAMHDGLGQGHTVMEIRS